MKKSDNKRKRWEAKQARRKEQNAKEAEQESWIRQNSHYCTRVVLEDVQRLKQKQLAGTANGTGTLEQSNSLVEELLHPYLDLKDGPPKSAKNQGSRLFIAEGTETVRLLVQQCVESRREGNEPIKVISILVKPATLFDEPVFLLREVQEAAVLLARKKDSTNDSSTQGADTLSNAPPFHLLVASEEALSECAGFHISRGALACGVVPERHESWLESFLLKSRQTESSRSSTRILALDGISDTANLGSMIRCAAAFGIDAIVLSNDCCDAWYRRSVRVSMGHIFNVPIVRVSDLSSTLRRLSIPSFAAVIDPDADLVLEQVARGNIPKMWCCVVGNEANGISSHVVEACTYRLRIEMATGVDSLSVPIATGIILHGLKEREGFSVT